MRFDQAGACVAGKEALVLCATSGANGRGSRSSRVAQDIGVQSEEVADGALDLSREGW